MYGVVRELKLVNIKVIKGDEALYYGLGSNVPNNFKVEFKSVDTIDREIVYRI